MSPEPRLGNDVIQRLVNNRFDPALVQCACSTDRCEAINGLDGPFAPIADLTEDESGMLVRMFDVIDGGFARDHVAAHDVALDTIAVLPAIR